MPNPLAHRRRATVWAALALDAVLVVLVAQASLARQTFTLIKVLVVEDGPLGAPIQGAHIELRVDAGTSVDPHLNTFFQGDSDPNGEVSIRAEYLLPSNILGLTVNATRAGYVQKDPAVKRLINGRNVLVTMERLPPQESKVQPLWARDSKRPDQDVLTDVAAIFGSDAVLGLSGLSPLELRTGMYSATRRTYDPSAPGDTEIFQSEFALDASFASFSAATLNAFAPNPTLAGRAYVDVPKGAEARAATTTGGPGFSLLTAANVGAGQAFLKATFDDTGNLVAAALEDVDPGHGGFFSDPQTMDRGDRPGAFSYDFEHHRFLELDPQSAKIHPEFAPGGQGSVLGRLFGGWQTAASPLADTDDGGGAHPPGRTAAAARASAGTLVFSSRSTSPTVLFDFTCRAGQSTLYLTEYGPNGQRIAEHALGAPIPTQVGHGCYPDHTQETAQTRYGDSWAVAYQAGDDLRLSTRSLLAGAEPATFSLGKQPSELDGIYFWKPALYGDRDSGGLIVDIPNGPAFEAAEDAQILGIEPWPLANPVLELPLASSGEQLHHALVSDLSGLGWLVGDFERADLPEAPPGEGDRLVAEVAVPGCLDTDTTFCANHNRFGVTARFTTPAGQSGIAHARPLTNDSGTFWFFDRDNRELIVKVLDACALNGHYWFFAAGLTDVAVDLEVWDRLTGLANQYMSEAGQSFQPILDTSAFECGSDAARTMEASVARLAGAPPLTLVESSSSSSTTGGDGTACGGAPEDICLNNGRFRVEVDFTDFGGQNKSAYGGNLTDDTGALFFFDQANVEMLIKVLDACAFGSYWVYAAGLTNVGVHVTVTDTSSGQTATYTNAVGKDFVPIADTATFTACSG